MHTIDNVQIKPFPLFFILGLAVMKSDKKKML